MDALSLFFGIIILFFLTAYSTVINQEPRFVKINEEKSVQLNVESQSRPSLKIAIITWNMAERSPTLADCAFLKQYLDVDILAVGIQECEDIRPRRQEGRRNRKWKQLRKLIIPTSQYKCLMEEKLGGLHLSIYLRKAIASQVSGLQTMFIPCGVGNVLSNKGAIVGILRWKDQYQQQQSIAFINAHFAAHQEQIEERQANYDRIVSYIRETVHSQWIHPIASQSSSRKKKSSKTKQKVMIINELGDSYVF